MIQLKNLIPESQDTGSIDQFDSRNYKRWYLRLQFFCYIFLSLQENQTIYYLKIYFDIVNAYFVS